MNTVANKMGQKVANVQEFTIPEKKLHQTVKKRNIGLLRGSMEYTIISGKGLEVHVVQY